MKTAVWIAVGALGVAFWTAIASRVLPWHLVPDAAVVTVVFVALRRELVPVLVTALLLGYLVGRQALAPVGLHETALVVCTVSVYLISGSIVGSGALFFSLVASATLVVYHLVLFGLELVARGHAGFSSWATAALLPNALATGLLALVSYPWMVRLERRLTPERHEGLSWS